MTTIKHLLILFIAAAILSTSSSQDIPVNDVCEDAITIQPRTDMAAVVTGSTLSATPKDLDCGTPNLSGGAVFYRFRGTGARFRVSTCTPETDFDTALSVETRFCDDRLFGCSDLFDANDFECDAEGEAATVELFTEPDTFYTITVGGVLSSSMGTFGLSLLEYARPENDICGDAITIQPRPDASTVVTGSTLNATSQNLACATPDLSGGAVFYRFRGTGSRVRVSTCTPETDFDTAISVETRLCDDSLFGCSDAFDDVDFECDSEGNGATVELDTVEDDVYTITVGGILEGSKGSFGLSLQDLEAMPVDSPTLAPMDAPVSPTEMPQAPPTLAPTDPPMSLPTTNQPQTPPTFALTEAPVTPPTMAQPQALPTFAPTEAPVAVVPTVAPENDVCEDAITIQPRTDMAAVVTGSTLSATPEDLACATPDLAGGAVFYRFRGTGARFRVSTCTPETDFDTALSVETRFCDDRLFGCSDQFSANDFECDAEGEAATVELFTEPDTFHTITVGGVLSSSMGTFGLSLLEYVRPENDVCGDAITIEPRFDASTVAIGSTLNATSKNLACATPDLTGGAVFYRFRGTGSRVRVSTCTPETDFDTAISVETRLCDDSLFGCSDAFDDVDFECDSEGNGATVGLDTVEDDVYTITVGGVLPTIKGTFGLSLQDLGDILPTMSPTEQSIPEDVIAPTMAPTEETVSGVNGGGGLSMAWIAVGGAVALALV